jgi:signal peptidase II
MQPASDTPAGPDERPAGAAPAARPAPSNRLSLIVVLVAALVVLADQVTKYWAVSELTGREPVRLVGSLLKLHLTRNAGAAFSFATGTTWVFTIIATVVAIAILRISRRLGSRWWTMALGLLLGGAVGNLSDRLFRPPGFARGHVVDFLELPNFPVFNVADSCICVAAATIAVLGGIGIGIDGSRVTRAKDEDPDDPADAAGKPAAE